MVLDGIASTYLGRGRIPAARAALEEARAMADRSGDHDALAAVHFSLMTVAHTQGALAEAARHGWESFLGFRTHASKLRALTALGGVFLAGGSLDSAEDAFTLVERESGDRYYRLYALAGLARVEAGRGDREAFEAANRRLDEAGFKDGAPEFRAEALLERGDGYVELGMVDEARRWYRRAIRISERHGVSEYLIRADRALTELEAGGGSRPFVPSPRFDDEGVDRIRRDLGALRRQPAGLNA
jgi:tetratricopeptide (TPR) repeat protein